MSGTFATKILGNGQLPNAIGDLYTVPAATQAIVRTIILVNVSGAAKTTNLYIKKSGGTARRIWEQDFSLADKAQSTFSEILTLATGDKIQGDASAVTSVDYSIFGIEES